MFLIYINVFSISQILLNFLTKLNVLKNISILLYIYLIYSSNCCIVYHNVYSSCFNHLFTQETVGGTINLREKPKPTLKLPLLVLPLVPRHPPS